MSENMWKEMYMMLVRGIAEAGVMLPITAENEPAAERMNLALQEAEEYYMTHAGE